MGTKIELSKEEKQVLFHTLGLNDLKFYEEIRSSRNAFYTSKDSTDYSILESLIEKGLMYDSGKGWEEGSTYFHATPEGLKFALSSVTTNSETKPSRSKRRYLCYLHSESCEEFIDWLQNPYWNDCRKRYQC